MARRKIEQWIGLIGGLLGILLAALVFAITSVGSYFHVSSNLGGPATVTLLFSLIGLFGALIFSSRKHDGGMIMIVIGVAGIIALAHSPAFVAPFILLTIAGAIALL